MRIFTHIIVLLAWFVPLWWCAWAVFRRPSGKLGRAAQWRLGVGWLAVWAWPTHIWQMATEEQIGGRIMSMDDLWEWVIGFTLPWPVHLGGATVAAVFENTAKAVSGHRQSTLIDNLPWWLVLTGIQTAFIAWAFVARWRQRASLRDPVLVALGALVLANSLVNAEWPWWGS